MVAAVSIQISKHGSGRHHWRKDLLDLPEFATKAASKALGGLGEGSCLHTCLQWPSLAVLLWLAGAWLPSFLISIAAQSQSFQMEFTLKVQCPHHVLETYGTNSPNSSGIPFLRLF